MMKRPSKLERMPTYAAIEAVKPRPVTLATFDNLGKEDEKEEEAPGAQSARAAFRSWSITGGTRDASFRKRQTGGGSSLALLALPAGKQEAAIGRLCERVVDVRMERERRRGGRRGPSRAT